MAAMSRIVFSFSLLASAGLAGCATAPVAAETAPMPVSEFVADTPDSQFQADREAILSMAGNFKVKFDFNETAVMKLCWWSKIAETSSVCSTFSWWAVNTRWPSSIGVRIGSTSQRVC